VCACVRERERERSCVREKEGESDNEWLCMYASGSETCKSILSVAI